MEKVRISKDYDVRKGEILETAKEMFYTIGYENTSVEKLILKIGIAKGTFYHYFKSKTDLLNQLVKQEMTPVLERIEDIKNQRDFNALEKFNRVITSLNQWKMDQSDLYKIMFKLMYSQENLQFRHKILELQLELFTPHYAEIIREGMEEGLFYNTEPQETAEVLILMGDRLKQNLAKAYSDAENEEDRIRILLEKIKPYERLIHRLIGVRKGEIKLLTPEIFQDK